YTTLFRSACRAAPADDIALPTRGGQVVEIVGISWACRAAPSRTRQDVSTVRGQPLMRQYSHRKRARRLTKRQIFGGTTVGYAGWGRETRSRVRRVAALVPACAS